MRGAEQSAEATGRWRRRGRCLTATMRLRTSIERSIMQRRGVAQWSDAAATVRVDCAVQRGRTAALSGSAGIAGRRGGGHDSEGPVVLPACGSTISATGWDTTERRTETSDVGRDPRIAVLSAAVIELHDGPIDGAAHKDQSDTRRQMAHTTSAVHTARIGVSVDEQRPHAMGARCGEAAVLSRSCGDQPSASAAQRTGGRAGGTSRVIAVLSSAAPLSRRVVCPTVPAAASSRH